MLFLSDNVKEVDAAIAAGMKFMLVDRPGNAPVSDEDRARLEVVQTLDEVKLAALDVVDSGPKATQDAVDCTNGAERS